MVQQENKLHGAIIEINEVINILKGKDGFEVITENNIFYILIDSHQDCCEHWGYISSEDDLDHYIGSELRGVRLTDVALNSQMVEKSGYYDDGGGIQFVDFVTNRGNFQLAVYNAHNGYYGHEILIIKDDDVLHKDYL